MEIVKYCDFLTVFILNIFFLLVTNLVDISHDIILLARS